MSAEDKIFVKIDSRPLHDLLYIGCRRLRRIAAVAAICVTIAVCYVTVQGPFYTASVRVLVGSDPGDGAGPQAPLEHGQAARNQAELLSDPGLIRRLLPGLRSLPQADAPGWLDRLSARLGAVWRQRARSLGLVRRPDPGTRLAERISRALRVTAVGDTDVIALSLTWSDPAFAASALNLILAGYQGAVTQAEHARLALHLAETRLADAQAQLNALDERILAATPGGDADQVRRERQRMESRLAAERADADTARLDRELARRKLEAVEKSFRAGGWVDSPDAADSPSGTPALQQSFVALLDRRQTLLAKLPADSPKVHALDQQIARVREQNYRGIRQLLSARIAGLDAGLARDGASIADDEAGLRDLDARQSSQDVLAQARAAEAARVMEERRRTEAARQRLDPAWVEVGSTRVLSEAVPPAEPDWPAPALVLEAACLAGLVLGLAAAMAAERTRRTIDRPEDVARFLNIETLALLETYR